MNDISDDLDTKTTFEGLEKLEALDEVKPIITNNTDPTIVMNIVKQHIDQIIDNMEDYSRMTTGDMTDKVVAATGLKISIVSGLVMLITRSNQAVSVDSGRNGGIIKGGRKPHIDNRPRCETCHQVVKPGK